MRQSLSRKRAWTGHVLIMVTHHGYWSKAIRIRRSHFEEDFISQMLPTLSSHSVVAMITVNPPANIVLRLGWGQNHARISWCKDWRRISMESSFAVDEATRFFHPLTASSCKKDGSRGLTSRMKTRRFLSQHIFICVVQSRVSFSVYESRFLVHDLIKSRERITLLHD